MDNSKNGSSPPPNDESSKGNERDAVLQFISERLMEDEEEEEELSNNPFHDDLALQTTEKSLHDALHNINLDTSSRTDSSKEVSAPKNGSSPPPNDESSKRDERDVLLQFMSEMLMDEEEEDLLSNNPFHDGLALQATEKSLFDALHNINLDSQSLISPNLDFHSHNSESRNEMTGDYIKMVGDTSGSKKNYRSREDGDLSEHDRSNKQSANNNADEENEPLEMYDDVLLCSNSNCTAQACGKEKKQSHRKLQSAKKEFIDLRSLLMQCAQAVEGYDNKTLNDLLWQIRQHSSPEGDGMERLAHYFASALEARLYGIGTELYGALNSERISAADVLRAYKMYVVACPFKQMSNIMANWTIGDLSNATRATTIHVIDFGILYGLQWPCLIHALSERTGGPLFFRITAIDFPQPGFRPAERVVESCRHLAKWAERFGVPFEYNVIAQKWDTVELEDLKIAKNELLVVNCMYRLHNVPDESETGESPRDAVLNLIKKINPDLFVHGIANGTYDTPFFVRRFREAFFHFASMFDMFDATMPQDDEDRLLYEKQFFGKEIMNIVACEGTERVERPEKYKQWQRRIVRVGFRQVPIDQRIVRKLEMVRTGYDKSFSVDEEGNWVLLGWKGRVVQGFSCWRPTHN